jgi:hypothetical protein
MTPIEKLIKKTLTLDAKSTNAPWFATADCCWHDQQDKYKLDTWTVGPIEDEPNWNNDSNQPGYGMLKKDAELVAAYRTSAPILAKALKIAIDGLEAMLHPGCDETIKEINALVEEYLPSIGEILDARNSGVVSMDQFDEYFKDKK